MAGSMGHDAGSRKLGLDVPWVRNGDERFLGPHGSQVEVEGRGVVGGKLVLWDWTLLVLLSWTNDCRIIEREGLGIGLACICIAAEFGIGIRSMSSGKSSARDRALGTLEIECRSCG
jgi:hypothetical protein